MNHRSKAAALSLGGDHHDESTPISYDLARLGRQLASERAARAEAEAERDRLRRDLDAANADRDAFLSAMAHDLRTPLAALTLQMQGLLAHPERNTGERLISRLRAMDRQARHMTALVNRFLDFMQLSGGRLQLTPEEVDLAELACDVAHRFEPELEWARCTLTIHVGAKVVGMWDRLHLEQVAGNLLANAIKYGAGAPITIEVSDHGPRARLVVRDQGVGIAPHEHDKIFERFAHASPARTFNGTGLGLWIVRQIVEASGGTISVDSRPGAGSTFTVDLPRGPVSA
jgi:signal transduction histidine kinase